MTAAIFAAKGDFIMTNAEQQLVEFCQALIRTPSLSGREEQVARLIQKTMLQ